jgi:hypothetical protein
MTIFFLVVLLLSGDKSVLNLLQVKKDKILCFIRSLKSSLN